MSVLPVLVPDGATVPPELAAALAWYGRVSAGRAVAPARPVAYPAPDWSSYAARGGRGRAPGNSQGLVAALLGDLPAEARVAVAAAGADPLVVVPDGAGFAPHTWRLRRGGVHLGGRRWARRYAVVPAGATLGTFAHELGHLRFGWPDLDRASRVGADCLMGSGGHHLAGGEPAPPCAPLRVEAGWVTPGAANRATTAAHLNGGAVYRAAGRDGDALLLEGRPLAGPARTVLAFAAGLPPRLVARIPLRPGDRDRPLLALLRAATLPAASAPAR